MERKSEGKISYDHAIEIAASFLNSMASGSRSEQQAVARVNLGPEIAAILLIILQGSTRGNTEILGNEVLPKKMF